MVAPADPNALLRAAEGQFAAGNMAEARRLLEGVLRLVPRHPQLLQFLSVICRRQGDATAAHRAAATAHAAAPGDPRIADTLGNSLSELGRHGDALAAYERAAALDPGFVEARLHRAAALQELGRLEDARAAYAALDGVEALLARAGLEIEAGELDTAAPLLDRILEARPNDPLALRSRARVAVERGEAGALDRLHDARAALPANRELLLDALGALADHETVALVEAAVRADPAWAAGRRALALFRREREGRTDWLADHEAAVAADPRDVAGWAALIELNAAADDHAAAARAADRAAAATGASTFRAAAFGYHAASGNLDAAARLLADPAVAAQVPPLTRAKYLLRRRDPTAAEALLARLCRAGMDDPETWALRGVAWQALRDPRFAWLNEQPGLVAPLDLGLASDEREEVVALLRRLHADAALRLGQSVRGGTQTPGNLFARIEPALRRLKAAIFSALEQYRAGLPPADPTHPLLRHRDAAYRMTASWSVRLTGGGFHVSHIHPKGVISSASYWVLPPPAPDDPQAGWLELGRPPAYLGLDLPASATLQPVPGQLVLFPSTLHHGTRPFAGEERITAAFDLAPR